MSCLSPQKGEQPPETASKGLGGEGVIEQGRGSSQPLRPSPGGFEWRFGGMRR